MAGSNYTVTHGANVTSQKSSENTDVIMIINSIVASVGVIGNLTVVIVLLNHRKLRRKIPNIFIILQVSGLPID